MAKTKVVIAIDPAVLARLDRLVAEGLFPSRSHAIRVAIEEKIARLERTRLARESAKLDPAFEKAVAEEGMGMCPGEFPAR